MHSVEIRDVPQQRAIGLIHRGAYNRIGDTFDTLTGELARQLIAPIVPKLIAVYFDDPGTTPETELRSLAGLIVDPDTQSAPPLEESDIPGGRYAVLSYKGRYSGLGEVWKWFYAEAPAKNGFEFRPGPSFELYLNTPADTAHNDLVTELFAPVA